MASVQEKNLSQSSRENSEKKQFILTFHKDHVHEVVGEFLRYSVPFSLDFSDKPDNLRVAFSKNDVPPTFIHDLWFDFIFGFVLDR